MDPQPISSQYSPSLFPTGGFLYNRAKQEILLHLRDGNTPHNPNKWAFFGGMSEEGETPVECFVRELKEEIGLTFSREDAVLFREYDQKDTGMHKFEFFIESDVNTVTMTLGEGAGFKWILVSDVFAYNLSPRTREGLEYFIHTYII